MRTVLSLVLLLPAVSLAAPTLGLSGSCPGPMDIDLSGFTPDARIGFLLSRIGPGSDVIPAGPCAGVETGLTGPRWLNSLYDADGAMSFSPSVPDGACTSFIQMLDVSTCTLTAVGDLGAGAVIGGGSPIHNTVPFVADATNSAPFDCSFPAYQNAYEWADLGAMTWNECAIEASKRGAMHAPDDSYSAGNGWFGFRTELDGMIDGWSVIGTAAVDSAQRCVVGRAPSADRDSDVLGSEVVYDGLTWSYADLGAMYYDQCVQAAGNAGATMVPPMSLGLPQVGSYWIKSVHGCNVYGMIDDTGALVHNNYGYGAQSSLQTCMIAYVELDGVGGGAEPYGFQTDWVLQEGTLGQATKCESVTDGGTTCVNPEIK
ncbi:MAG: hypothetical protein ACI8PZ_001322, partial [Myxococcota bacterium]